MKENIIADAHSFLSNPYIPSGSDLIRSLLLLFIFIFFFSFALLKKISYMFPLYHVFCNHSLNIWFLKKNSLGQEICVAFDKPRICKTILSSMHLETPSLCLTPWTQKTSCRFPGHKDSFLQNFMQILRKPFPPRGPMNVCKLWRFPQYSFVMSKSRDLGEEWGTAGPGPRTRLHL